ncbi:hypothetical protein JL721_6648 [Aureococcus anophagefferens]|nr:hypothetical protein JL721_6648 [Aureococcus anophagefferens]
MVVRVNYDGPWPPEQPAEGLHGDRYEVRGVVTKVVASAQLLHASRASGCLKHNAGAANVRTVAAISVAVDAAAAFPMFLDVDASGFADKIMSMTIAEQAPAPSTNDDVEDDEWDD